MIMIVAVITMMKMRKNMNIITTNMMKMVTNVVATTMMRMKNMNIITTNMMKTMNMNVAVITMNMMTTNVAVTTMMKKVITITMMLMKYLLLGALKLLNQYQKKNYLIS